MKTKSIDVSKFFDNVPTTVTIKKFNAGDIAEIRSTVRVNMLGEIQNATPDMGTIFLLTLLKGIYQSPFQKNAKITMEEIREIDGDIADFIADEINTFNNISPN